MRSRQSWKNKNKIGLELSSRCPVCGMEEEDNYHPFLRCQFGRDLYLAMAKIWKLPAIESVLPTGKEWLLQVLAPLGEIERSMMLLIFWRSWYVRNELVHYKPAPPMHVSISFLQKHMVELMSIKLNSQFDPAKGKAIITFDPAAISSNAVGPVKEPAWFPPVRGWVKLNTDGSFVSNAVAGAGMILRNNVRTIIYSACRVLWSCRDALEAELCACMEGLSLALLIFL